MKTAITSFATACTFLQIPETLPDVTQLPEQYRKPIETYYQLVVINRALNREANGGQDWYPDWNDSDQYKWHPWFDMETYGDAPAGSGFAFHDCDYDYDLTVTGSRLCYINEEVAKYAGTCFIELYREYFLLNPQQ